MDIPYLDRDEIAAQAHGLCASAFAGEIPCPVDLDALLFDYLYEEHGLAFYNHEPLGEDGEHQILGITYPLLNEIHVCRTLRDSASVGRYRFTVAHEIGHWVLHRPLFLDDDSPDFSTADGEPRLVTFQRDVVEADQDSYRPEEWQANHFAISLLLHDDPLRREFARRFGEPPVELEAFEDSHPVEAAAAREAYPDIDPIRRLSRGVASGIIDDLPALADLFLLSVEATAIALEERGYVVETLDS